MTTGQLLECANEISQFGLLPVIDQKKILAKLIFIDRIVILDYIRSSLGQTNLFGMSRNAKRESDMFKTVFVAALGEAGFKMIGTDRRSLPCCRM
ncbi:hypothetical protein [Rhizobium terrae]|uniref:hypothetical protein n=1 Tax=Rhizobium terrae TaxID=2171756 RepID=UPI000E3CC889|nr:hypothetical protein [Rhizobium terrae]